MPLSCDCQYESVGLCIRSFSAPVAMNVSKQIIMRALSARYLALLLSVHFWAIALTVTLPAQISPAPILNNLLTPNFTILHNATSPPNNLPPDPYIEEFLGGEVKFSDYGSRLSGTDVTNCINQLRDVLKQQEFNPKGRVGTKVRNYDSGNVRLSLHPKPWLIWEDLRALFFYLRDFYQEWDTVAMQFGINSPKNIQVAIGLFAPISAEE